MLLAEPEITCYHVADNSSSSFIVLATDGLWGFVNTEKVRRRSPFATRPSPPFSPQDTLHGFARRTWRRNTSTVETSGGAHCSRARSGGGHVLISRSSPTCGTDLGFDAPGVFSGLRGEGDTA